MNIRIIIAFLFHFYYLIAFASAAFANDVIIVMGASCSGKSTLSEKLVPALGSDWKLVELDTIEDNLKLEHKKNGISEDISVQELQTQLVKEMNSALTSSNVVVDTNLYEKTMDDRLIKGNTIYKILIHAPLKTLLERDQRRTKNRKRTEKRAIEARKFVIKTYENFEKMLDLKSYDLKIETSSQTAEKSLEQMLSWYKDKKIALPIQ